MADLVLHDIDDDIEPRGWRCSARAAACAAGSAC